MSQVTQRSATSTPPRRPDQRPDAHPDERSRHGPGAGWFLEGVLAAVLGLAGLAVCVLVLWTVSPYPESSVGGAARMAADLWLLGHGSALERTVTPDGVPAPVALTPLLLVVPPVWLLYRAYAQALGEAFGDREESAGAYGGVNGRRGSVLAPLVCVAGGYLATGAVAVVFAAAGSVRADVTGAMVRLPLFALCLAIAALWPAWAGAREPGTPATGRSATDTSVSDEAVPARQPSWRASWHGLRTFARRARPLRTALTGTAVLCGGGFVLLCAALLWHADEVHAAFRRLAGESGAEQLGLLLLVLALLPNAAVWAAAYALGPGFALGAGTTAAPLDPVPGLGPGDGGPVLPPFPLLEALPDGRGLLACAVPLVAAAVVGRRIGRAAVPVPGPYEGTASRTATVAAVVCVAGVCAVAVAVLAAGSGGALGTRNLAVFGPDRWSAGTAAFAWFALVGSMIALAVRTRRLRAESPGGQSDDWHATGARHTRWAALKTASGGLMPDFTPRRD